MSDLATICTLVSAAAGIAALFLAALFIVVIRSRKSSLAWINRLFICFVVAVGGQSLATALSPHPSDPPALLVIRVLIGIAMLACAVLTVPLYKRVRRHPQYDQLQAANQQLEYAQRLFKTFIDETPFAAYVVDEKDRFLYVNTKVSVDHGVAPESMIGTTYLDWLPPHESNRLIDQNAQVRASRCKQEFVVEVSPRSSSKRTYLSNKFPLPGPKGELLVGVVSVEISDELQSKAMDSLLASIVEVAPEAIYTVSDGGLITSWNKGAQQILGYSSDEIIGQPATMLAPPRRAHHFAKFISLLEDGQVLNDRNFFHMTKDGRRLRLLLSATKIKSFIGEGSSYVAIARDETEARRAALEMKTLNRKLDLRIAELSKANAQLPLARDQALEASSLKSAFVANISHEIRTPLSGILGVSELILNKQVNEETCDMVKTVSESAEALLWIVNDILDLSKLEDGRLSLDCKQFSPRDLLKDCLKIVTPGAASKLLDLSVSIDPQLPDAVLGDASKVRQILLNLLGNAIKFTERGEVGVQAILLKEKSEQTFLKFSVTDTGFGIAPEDAHLLFTPFSRIEKSTRGIKGSGLGLAISKRFVDLMGGQIGFESKASQGCLFWFSVPFQKVDKAASDAPATEQGIEDLPLELLSNRRVLSVEDNRVLSALTMRQLSNIGIEADSVATGREAIEKLTATKYDIILLDVNLPDIDGYEVTRQIRQLEKVAGPHRHIIVAMTAGAMQGDRERALQAGMDDYMAKPVNVKQLRKTIFNWLQKRVTEDGLKGK